MSVTGRSPQRGDREPNLLKFDVQPFIFSLQLSDETVKDVNDSFPRAGILAGGQAGRNFHFGM